MSNLKTRAAAPAVPPGGGAAVAYHTIDGTNAAFAVRRLAAVGVAVELVEPRDGLRLGEAAVIDADFFWTDDAEREAGVAGLLGGSAVGAVVAVHGWRLTDDQLDRLRAAGVIADRKLARVVRELAARLG